MLKTHMQDLYRSSDTRNVRRVSEVNILANVQVLIEVKPFEGINALYSYFFLFIKLNVKDMLAEEYKSAMNI